MTKKVDCLLIGHNEMSLPEFESRVKKYFGEQSEAYRDLSLNIVEYDGQICTPIDLLNRLRLAEKSNYKNGPLLKHVEISPAVAYLGSFLSEKGLSIDFINMFQDEKEELARKLIEEQILTIAITTTLYFTPTPILEIVSFIRQYNREVRIIVGGPFIYNQYLMLPPPAMEQIYQTINADFYIINSQGETALAQLIHALKNNFSGEQIPNVVCQNQGKYEMPQIVPEDNKLEENMVDWNLFSHVIGDYVSLRTSISCPFACSFCGHPQRAGSYKYIGVSTLEENLDLLSRKTDVKVIHFIDDTFNVPQERFKDILRMMIKNKYRFKWNSMFRCQYADRETIELMKESNCQGVFLGIESASDRILKAMNKNATAEKFRAGMELLREYDFITYTSFIVGFPGETEETVQETFDFIQTTKPTFFRTQLWYCDPITPIMKEREQYCIQGAGLKWSHRTMDSKTACDLIDQIFLKVEDSIWLTQYKFEFPYLYYLLNHGMSLEQVKEFLRCHNMLVGNKLKREEMRVDEQEVLQRLLKVAKFDLMI